MKKVIKKKMMIKYKLWLKILFLLFFGNNINSQELKNRFSDNFLDSIINSKKIDKKNKYLKSIAEKLKIEPNNDVLQVSIISKWIVNYLHYDNVATGANYTFSLQGKKAVCSQYSFFFDSLARYCGLEVNYIKGYVKLGLDSYELHAWNSVKIEGRWLLLDLTWCDVNIDDVKLNFNRTFFLVEPNLFVMSHFPLKTRFKYSKYSKRKFKNSPNYLGGYNFLINNFSTNLSEIKYKNNSNLEINFVENVKAVDIEILNLELVFCKKNDIFNCKNSITLEITKKEHDTIIFSTQHMNIDKKMNTKVVTLLVNYKYKKSDKIQGMTVMEFYW